MLSGMCGRLACIRGARPLANIEPQVGCTLYVKPHIEGLTVAPVAAREGHDLPRLIDEGVPGETAPAGMVLSLKPYSTTSHATTWPGSSVPPCVQRTFIDLALLAPPVLIKPPSWTDHSFSRTTAHLTLPAIWPVGSWTTASSTCA